MNLHESTFSKAKPAPAAWRTVLPGFSDTEVAALDLPARLHTQGYGAHHRHPMSESESGLDCTSLQAQRTVGLGVRSTTRTEEASGWEGMQSWEGMQLPTLASRNKAMHRPDGHVGVRTRLHIIVGKADSQPWCQSSTTRQGRQAAGEACKLGRHLQRRHSVSTSQPRTGLIVSTTVRWAFRSPWADPRATQSLQREGPL